ncbi:COPII coat GTPase [Glugoides intestinalis]
MASSVYEFTEKLKSSISDLYHFTIGWFVGKLFKKPSSILFLGIDNAGKTTLVNKLKTNTNHVYLPTKHATKDLVEIGNLKARVIDIGGHRAVRVAWKDYFYNVDGIVFLVDVADDKRYNEVAESWKAVLELEKKAPIIVLMNKIDLLSYNSETAELDTAFRQGIEASTGISSLRNPQQDVKITYLSVLKEDVYKESTPLRASFEWLSKKIGEKDAREKTASLL